MIRGLRSMVMVGVMSCAGCNISAPEYGVPDAPVDVAQDERLDLLDAQPDVPDEPVDLPPVVDVPVDLPVDQSTDASRDAPEDAPMDVPGDAPADDAPDEQLPACSSIASSGWSACQQSGTRCELVFEDMRTCEHACAVLGRTCVQSYDNVPGQCAADLTRPWDCADKGHMSDYCVCDVVP